MMVVSIIKNIIQNINTILIYICYLNLFYQENIWIINILII